MILYIAFVQDRHADPLIRVFSVPEKAIAFTRREFAACVARPNRIIEHRPTRERILRLTYGEDGDYAYVMVTTLDDNSEA